MSTRVIRHFQERDRVNNLLSFVSVLALSSVQPPDIQHLSTPVSAGLFHDNFFNGSTIDNASIQDNTIPLRSRQPIEIPLHFTDTDDDPEHRVAYWREDIGINLHHWHWHMIHRTSGPKPLVNKDRRGELFYYMHHQLLARYNVERYCNDLPHTTSLTNLREPIPEAYFPKFDRRLVGRFYPDRVANCVLSDIKNETGQFIFKISDVERFRDRIWNAIRLRTVVANNGSSIYLDDVKGIDILANTIESNILTPNFKYYGSLHNMVHTAIALCHDPYYRHWNNFQVMGNIATSMRDPLFYRWHSYLDSMYTRFKDSLRPYAIEELSFTGITVRDIRINTPNENPNILNTHWTLSEIELSRGQDFGLTEPVFVRVQYLNHDEYSYTISLINSNRERKKGLVRIFLAPKYDESGRELSVNTQRMLMIEMDKFGVELLQGQNIITRQSIDSTLTIPFEATFRNLNKGRPNKDDPARLDEFNFCGCGLPQHLLVPKGTEQGYLMDLFVMVTEYNRDMVVQPAPTGCQPGISFCGLKNLKYPDIRGMGYPFDRVMPENVQNLTEFLLPNMKVQEVLIRFNNITKLRQERYSQTVHQN